MNYGKHGRCEATARTTGERCGRPAVGTHGKCDIHGGTSTGPRDTTYLKGNDFAKGNPGGGAPELNTNALISGAWCDVEKVEARLNADARARVDTLTEAFVQRSDGSLPEEETREKAREIALLHMLEGRAQLDVLKRGIGWTEVVDHQGEEYEIAKVNPSFGRDLALSCRKRKLIEEIGFTCSSEPQVG